MSIVDNFLKKMKVVSEDEDFDEYDEDEEYDDYNEDENVGDDYDDEEEEEEEAPAKKKPLFSKPAAAYTQRSSAAPANNVVGMRTKNAGGPEVCMIVPKSFDDANTIADVLLSHRAVILNLENNDMASAQRIIDFASGACYTVGGTLQKISRKIFMIVPQDMNLSGDFEALVSDMVDLNSVNIMK